MRSSSGDDRPIDHDAPSSYHILVQHPLPPGHEDQEATLTCILTVLARERTLPRVPAFDVFSPPPELQLFDTERESARLRTYLLHTVAVDYNCPFPIALPELGCSVPAALTPADHAFFLALGTWFIQLYHANRAVRLSSKDLSILAPCLLCYLYTPAHYKLIGISVDIVVVTIICYLRSMERHGEYRGCCDEVLPVNGMNRFAEKA